MTTQNETIGRYKIQCKSPKGEFVRIRPGVYMAVRFYATKNNISLTDAASILIKEGLKTLWKD